MNQPINFIITLLIFNVFISCTSNSKELKSNEKNNIQLKNDVDSPKDSIVTKKMDVIEYEKGKLHFKLSEGTKTVLPEYDMAKPLLGQYPILQQIIENYQIIKIYKAFPQMETSNMSRMYTIEFEEKTNIDALIQDLNSIESIEYSEKIPINKSF